MTIAVQARLSAERRFYASMALFMLAVVFIGFAPSFYLRDYVHVPRPNPTLTPMVMLHGLAFTTWMLIFLAQTLLVSAGRRDLHIRLGQAGMVLAALLVPLMYMVSVGQVARANQPPFATPLGWTAVPLFIIPPFALLVGLGWRNRRSPQAHKRLMLGAALLMMDPAIGRLPLGPPVVETFAVLNLLSLLAFLPLLWWDWRTRGRLHWATALGAGLFGTALALRLFAIASPGWAAFAAHLPGV